MNTPALPAPRILMGPGPSCVSQRVLEALGRAPVGYLDPELFAELAELQRNLRTVFGTENGFTIAQTGTGMAGMEACFANLVAPGDRVVIGVNGFFGGRMVDIAERYGAEVTRIEAAWGSPLNPSDIERGVGSAGGPVKLVACVHAETSTGVRQPLEPIAEIAHAHGALFLVDAVTSLGGIPVEVDRIGIDACYSATQKCMGCPPGLSPLTVSDRAFAVATAGGRRPPSWYHDWRMLADYWGEPHTYHHTVPGNLLFAFAESLRCIVDEGLQARFARHQALSDALMQGIADLGAQPFAADGYRLPTLNAVCVPADVDDVAVRKALLTRFGIEIGGGLGPTRGKMWRIGTMGDSATVRSVRLTLAALADMLT